jgi:hypothetical protein
MLDCDVTARDSLQVKVKAKVKVNQLLYMPGETRRVPGDRGSQISRQSAHAVGKVVSPKHRPPLPPGNNRVDPRAIVWTNGL